jgi:hypothetical protein
MISCACEGITARFAVYSAYVLLYIVHDLLRLQEVSYCVCEAFMISVLSVNSACFLLYIVHDLMCLGVIIPYMVGCVCCVILSGCIGIVLCERGVCDLSVFLFSCMSFATCNACFCHA